MPQDRKPGRQLSAQDAAALQRGPSHARGKRLALTQAIRPAHKPRFPLREGYRIEIYKDPELGLRMPVLTAALSRHHLLPILMELFTPLGEVVDFILESSHEMEPASDGSPIAATWERTDIDLPVLTSILCGFEDLLLNDGCTGIAVLNAERDYEVHFDEHKLLYLYGPQLHLFEAILQRHGVLREDDLLIITEEEHIHSTSDEYFEQMNDLRQLIGVEDEVESASW
ncbi:MAG: hypothetical protein U0796_07755 [Gemmatales bacterium]